MEKYWWVNQNQTHRKEVAGGFLWSPKAKKNGTNSQYYINMTLVNVGDIVFSYYKSKIQTVGIIVRKAEDSIQPEFASQDNDWDKDGWLVGVEFFELRRPISPKNHMEILGPTLPEKYSPLRKNGDGLQNIYLTELSEPLANSVINLIGDEYYEAVRSLQNNYLIYKSSKSLDENNLPENIDFPETIKSQLIKARIGQGLFRANVRQIEKECRVTGTNDISHLIASHIKPWRDSTNEERLSGHNGLLLAPHVDHLFDKGLISFSDSGEILLSHFLNKKILEDWNLDLSKNVKTFNAKQKKFLEYHRENIFKK